MTGASSEVWPDWPAENKGHRLVDVIVACKADDLFILLWGQKSAYRVSMPNLTLVRASRTQGYHRAYVDAECDLLPLPVSVCDYELAQSNLIS